MLYSPQKFADEMVDNDEMRQSVSYEYYNEVEPLLRRMDYEESTSRQMRRSDGTCQMDIFIQSEVTAMKAGVSKKRDVGS